MDDLVNPYDGGHDLSTCYLPYEDLAHANHIHESKLAQPLPPSDELRQSTERPPDPVTAGTDELPGTDDQGEKQVTEEPPKKASISRSTYFRAKRNLKSHGSVRSASTGKQIGRPQKLDANAEKLIQAELARNPSSELKQLQALVLDQCNIQVSLSSISRRLKVLGCSPSQNNVHMKRTRKKSEDAPLCHRQHTPVIAINAMPQQQHPELSEFDQMQHLDDYDDMTRAFNNGIDSAELSNYDESPDMHLDMLDMQNEYSNLSGDLDVNQDNSHIYKYDAYDKDGDLHSFSPALGQDLYHQADHQRHMLFNDPNLSVSSGGWQEV